ncbi:MAG: hypothetical protein V2A56_13015 [bacterium]
MITTQFRRTVTLLAIAWYLPFVLTLDLHHNHGFPQPPPTNPAFDQSGFILQNADEDEICPVMRVMLAHGPLVSQPIIVFSFTSRIEFVRPCLCWGDYTRRASARDPPVHS